MITTDYTKCLTCRWRDRDNVQCYDGHLQRLFIKECDGYEHSIVSAKFKFEVQESKK